MTSIARNCPMCGGAASHAFVATDENRRIDDGKFGYLRCHSCATTYIENIPPDLGRYYQSDYYNIPDVNGLAKLSAKDRKIEIVKTYARTGTLLEVGPAIGVFAYRAKREGFTVDAIEMDRQCCKFLNETLKIPAVQSDRPQNAIAGLPQHDVVVAWHVMEHLPDPLAFLKAAAENLAKGGHLILAMPNPDAWQAAIMGVHWPHVDAPRHVSLIPLQSLMRIAAQFGLHAIDAITSDPDGKSWNRFGWQRLIMNRLPGKFGQRLGFIIGTLISIPFMIFDGRKMRGAAYTIVFQKKGAP